MPPNSLTTTDVPLARSPTSTSPSKKRLRQGRVKKLDDVVKKQSVKSGEAEPTADEQDVPETAISDPIPAGGSLSPSFKPTTLTVAPTFSIPLASSSSSSTDTLLRKTTTLWLTETPSSPTPPNKADSATGHSSPGGHLPPYDIALAIGGSICLGLVMIFTLKCLLRKKHKSHPTPSNPILQDSDSPLFGGKERFSRTLWGDPPLGSMLYVATNSANKVISNASTRNDGWRPLSGATDTEMGKMSEKGQSKPLSAPMPPPAISAAPPSIAPATAASSLGTAPPPFSPASVYTSAAPVADIGVALEDLPLPLPNNAKGLGTIQPLKLKDKDARDMRQTKAGRRRSGTTTAFTSPTITETEVVVAYSAPRPAPSPGKPKPALKSSGSSRDRIHGAQRKNVPSPATQQSSLPRRASRTDINDIHGDVTSSSYKRESFLYALPSVKSQERRDRDTKALTSALGLSSPSPQAPASACFSPVSLYPDDSLSVVDAHRHMSGIRYPGSEAGAGRVVSEMPSPTGTTAALGDLMLQEFPSIATFASLRGGDRDRDPFADSAAPVASRKFFKAPGRSNVSDKPPRVPSPPPLPSLAQMALERADSEYHSPTYSIYGLYEAERKSKASFRG